MMGIGLKYAWGKTKGCRLRHRISELIWEIRYVWQRVWKDYDETDIFAMNDRFIKNKQENHVTLAAWMNCKTN